MCSSDLCASGLCTDGYTEFCCTINDGINACPPNSFWGGWWRADYSSFCNGTRYYIDCMQYCCGPATGYGNFCAGCTECRCANGCDSRHIYCNYFRYGQCHTEIVQTGPMNSIHAMSLNRWVISMFSIGRNAAACHIITGTMKMSTNTDPMPSWV